MRDYCSRDGDETKVAIIFNVFGAFMEYITMSNLNSIMIFKVK